MYNRYINGSFDDFFVPVEDNAPPMPEPRFVDVETAKVAERPQRGGLLGGLFSGFKLPELDAETVILLVLVYFLVAEEGESVSDTLLIIGVLLLLGF